MPRRVFPLLLLAACGGRASRLADAGPDSSPRDALPSADAGPLPLVVDFTVANCGLVDSGQPSCTGLVPFAVQFVPITSVTISQYRWDFGDGTIEDTSAAPSHTFNLPGSFDVTLVGIDLTGGFVSQRRHGFITVLPIAMGDPCQADRQCASGLTCLCSNASPCTTGPLDGMCILPCLRSGCPDGQVCANLATAAAPSGRVEPWQTQVCLPQCRADADCTTGMRAGLHCRELPAWPSGTGWVHGCFGDMPAELGSPCRDATGVLRDDHCVSGLCADLGALGLCSSDCSDAACPVGSDCATFGDGRELCLVPCTASFLCDADPLLTCVAPGPSLLGYQLNSPANSGGGDAYCTPKPCSSTSGCGAAGICRLESGGGHCVARP